jgi:hypothetical protein
VYSRLRLVSLLKVNCSEIFCKNPPSTDSKAGAFPTALGMKYWKNAFRSSWKYAAQVNSTTPNEFAEFDVLPTGMLYRARTQSSVVSWAQFVVTNVDVAADDAAAASAD